MQTTAACVALSLAISAPSYAEDADAYTDVNQLINALRDQASELKKQEEALEDSRKKLEEQQQNLIKQRIYFNTLRAQASKLTGQDLSTIGQTADSESDNDGKKNTETQTASSEVPQEVGVERKEEEEAPQIAAVIDAGGVLLPKGKFVFTPQLEYTRSSATRVAIQGFSIIPAINIGLFEIVQTDRNTLTGSAGLRYGVTNRFELETRVPYVYRSDSTRTRPVGGASTQESTTEVDGNNIGDIEFAAHYQINDGTQGWPFFIGNLRFKTATGTSPYEVPIVAGVETELPTGSGFYALQPSVTAIYPSDPVVFYSNLGYLYNFERDYGATFGTVDPGDSISGSFGMSMSLNDKASFSLGYSHNTVFEPTVNGQRPVNSRMLQVGSLDIGYSYALNDYTNLNFSVSAGITDDAPDARLIFRAPISFTMDDIAESLN